MSKRDNKEGTFIVANLTAILNPGTSTQVEKAILQLQFNPLHIKRVVHFKRRSFFFVRLLSRSCCCLLLFSQKLFVCSVISNKANLQLTKWIRASCVHVFENSLILKRIQIIQTSNLLKILNNLQASTILH